MVTATLPATTLPPGSNGLPGLGETLAFVKDPFAFVQDRRAQHGRVFRTNLLGRKTAVLSGPEPLEAFYDPANVVREGANPGNIQTLFGGPTVVNGLDGDAHARRRRSVEAALSREAIESYLPTMTRFVDAAFARWCEAGEIAWNDELKRLVIETLGAVFASLEPGPDLVALVQRCERIAAAFTSLPIPLPGTPYTNGVRAKDDALAYYRTLVRAHRERTYDDGLARLLAARLDDGTTIADDDAPGELHHLFLAGFIVFGQLATTIVSLTQYPDVRERLAAAVATLSEPPTLRELAANAYLMQVVNEVRRLAPIVPIVMGKARRAFVVDGFTIPEGWGVAAAVWTNDREAASFPDPERFDPDRFGERAEHRAHAFAYTPQGAGPPDGHRCPGFDLTAIFMALFTARLVRGYDWTLPPQDLTPNWPLVPPVPRSGLRAVVRARG
ncbi:MAG: cytochrome P450 [Candidatus Eremiobacteraeota bacterium]|nr:cytochrome P450 [Candidatus Eremiobacteraeota bacterium]